MTISGVEGASPSYKSPETLEMERSMLVLAKQQDMARAQAQAMVDLIKPASSGGRLDVYA